MTGNMPYFIVGLLFMYGLFAVIFERNLIKIAVGVALIETATNMLLIVYGYRTGASIPILTFAGESSSFVLPAPQALTLTAIVIGLATNALMLSFVMLLHRHYGTLDVREIRRLRG